MERALSLFVSLPAFAQLMVHSAPSWPIDLVTPSPQEDAGAKHGELLSACVAGSSGAWRELHRRYHPVALAFLRKLGVDGRELDDAVQEVFVQVHRYLDGFRGDSRFETWLYRLCVTQARRARQRARLGRLLKELLALEPQRAAGTGPMLDATSARGRVDSALARMTPACREAFVLCEMEGLEGPRAAEVLGCRLPTLWRRLHDARKQFRHALLEHPLIAAEGAP